MTITLKPVHLALIAIAVVAAIATGVVLAINSGGGETKPLAKAVDTATAEASPAPTATVAPTAQPAVPTQEAAPNQEPAPAVVADAPPRSCDDIRATGYANDGERTFFLANCLTAAATAAPTGAVESNAPPASNEAPAAPAAPAPTKAPSGPNPDEARYRSQATAQLGYLSSRLAQYYNTPSLGVVNDIYEMGSIARNLGNAMGSLEPVPPRFRAVHNELRDSHLDFADYTLTIEKVSTEDELIHWLVGFFVRIDRMNSAIEDFNLVVGVKLPRIPR